MDERPPRPFALYSAGVFLAGLLALGVSLMTAPPDLDFALLLLLLSAALSEAYALELRMFTVSLAFPLIVAAIVVAGPAGSGLVAAASFTNWREIQAGRPLSALAFNFGQLALSGCIAGWFYAMSAWPTLTSERALTPAWSEVGAVFIAAFLFAIVNLTLLTVAVRLGKGVAVSRVLREFIQYIPTQAALAAVGLLIAQVLTIRVIAFPLLLFPLFSARQVYQNYANLSDAYVDTVRTLVNALEAKDAYTRGHSERVAGYAVALARAVDLDERQQEMIERAALLHDIGKLRLPLSLLVKPGPLNQHEQAEMRRHPAVGGDMVARIKPLRPLASVIVAHHERIDGSGYPSGTSASDVPLAARILAIADAYDAMTTSRAYRPAMGHAEALGELQRCAGLQFDASLVETFAGLPGSGLGYQAVTMDGARDRLCAPAEVSAS